MGSGRCSSFGSSAIESWAGPLLETVAISGTPSPADVENGIVDALGDDVGGFKSGYLHA